LQHRRRGTVAGIDRMPEPGQKNPGQQLGGPLLDPVQQPRADAPPPVPGMDDPPELHHGGFLAPGLPVGHDRLPTVDHHPGVAGEVEAHPAPLVLHKARVQDALTRGVEVVGDEHLGHGIEVLRSGRSDPIVGREIQIHAEKRTAHPWEP
jgi:hypothetical protein